MYEPAQRYERAMHLLAQVDMADDAPLQLDEIELDENQSVKDEK